MTIIKNLIVAFSLYSKIPMPIFEWKEKDMKHNIVFLPVVGLIIGGVSYGLFHFFKFLNAPNLLTMCVLALVPILITGGFHIDGFMDVRDALSSYAEKEKKLEILKDPHIGAFSVIHLAALSLLWMASLSVLGADSTIEFSLVYAFVFFIARAVGGALSIKLKKAKKEGMLNMEIKSVSNMDFVILAAEAFLGLVGMAFVSPVAAAIIVCDIVIYAIYYKRMAYKNFGGVTGDLTGFFIVSFEALVLFTTAVACLCV